MIPAVVYGPGQKNVSIAVDEREFKKVLRTAGESSLIELSVDGEQGAASASSSAKASADKKASASQGKKPVLVHDMQKNPVSGKIIHIDFLQPSLTEEVEVKIPLVFEGTAPAEKDLGGTFMKNMSEIEVKALPQNLPHQIVVSIDNLKTFEDHITIKDLVVPENVKILKQPDEIVASVLPPQKVEEELAAEIKENVEDVEKVEKPKKEEVVIEEPKETK